MDQEEEAGSSTAVQGGKEWIGRRRRLLCSPLNRGRGWVTTAGGRRALGFLFCTVLLERTPEEERLG